MAKAQIAEPKVDTDALMNMIADLSAQVQTLTAVKEEEDEEENDGPEHAKTNNAAARVLVAQVGDCIQAEGYQTPIPERVMESGPAAVKKFLKKWNKGQGVSARQISDSDLSLAETAHM